MRVRTRCGRGAGAGAGTDAETRGRSLTMSRNGGSAGMASYTEIYQELVASVGDEDAHWRGPGGLAGGWTSGLRGLGIGAGR